MLRKCLKLAIFWPTIELFTDVTLREKTGWVSFSFSTVAENSVAVNMKILVLKADGYLP
jgi:hypothetical protein